MYNYSSLLYEAHLISTIVDRKCDKGDSNLYEAHLISTIVDREKKACLSLLYEAHLISTIVDFNSDFDNLGSMRLI